MAELLRKMLRGEKLTESERLHLAICQQLPDVDEVLSVTYRSKKASDYEDGYYYEVRRVSGRVAVKVWFEPGSLDSIKPFQYLIEAIREVRYGSSTSSAMRMKR